MSLEHLGIKADGSIEKKKDGCFLYGCLTIIVVSVLVLAISCYLVYKSFNVISEVVDTYSESSPRTIQVFESEKEDYRIVSDKIMSYLDSPKGESSTLSLSASDLNTIYRHKIQTDFPDFKAFFKIENNVLNIDSSFDLAVVGYKDKYLNSQIIIISDENDHEELVIKSVQLAGKDPSEKVLKYIEAMNPTESFFTVCAEADAELYFDKVTINNNQIVISKN